MAKRRRVVITGIGIVSPLGIGTDVTWSRVCAGESGIGPITRFDATDFPSRIAGEVSDFDPSPWIPKRAQRQMDLFIQYALAASDMAVESAGLDQDKPDPERYGCYVGAGLGGILWLEKSIVSLREKGPRHGISPYFVPAIIINLAPGQISIRHDCKGPNMSMVSACSTGAHSIGEAARAIERGDADVMISGGTESTVSPVSIGGFSSARALSTSYNDQPATASRPFTKSRDGFVLSEGCGLVILEERDRARARGVQIIAELVGYAANADAHHITAPPPDGAGARRCMELAIADAGIAPAQVGYINAHGTSTAADSVETRAIRDLFGAHADRIAVSSTKSMHGHLLGAAGGLEAAICALALRDGVLPPTINLHDPDPECDLDYVPHEARKVQVEYAMSNSFGFGGTNAALVLGRGD
jgi:3-oxoacyl-[acyl-carrier-protein] synthase II